MSECAAYHNALEQWFGSFAGMNDALTGRTTVPGLVVARPVRVLAAVVSHSHVCVSKLSNCIYTPGLDHLRDQLETRHDSIVCKFRFRKDPQAYLATTEGYPHQGGFAALVFLLFDT